jgi:hypothetical protein
VGQQLDQHLDRFAVMTDVLAPERQSGPAQTAGWSGERTS